MAGTIRTKELNVPNPERPSREANPQKEMPLVGRSELAETSKPEALQGETFAGISRSPYTEPVPHSELPPTIRQKEHGQPDQESLTSSAPTDEVNRK
jgi:hypothetical protein